MKIKLKKYLSNAGYCSRRKAKDFIENNAVTINGKRASNDSVLQDRDVLIINTKKEIVNLEIETDILIYHKPTGEICSSKGTDSKKSVFESIPKRTQGKWIMVGRLDVNTSGLLIFSNNGDLVQKLSHPSSAIKRYYLCRVFGNPKKSQIKKLLNGVEIDGNKSCFDEIIPMKKKTNAKNNWFKVSLHSGKNREVRKLWETESLKVSRLIRIGFGPIELPEDLKKGQYRCLEKNAVERVIKLTGMEG